MYSWSSNLNEKKPCHHLNIRIVWKSIITWSRSSLSWLVGFTIWWTNESSYLIELTRGCQKASDTCQSRWVEFLHMFLHNTSHAPGNSNIYIELTYTGLWFPVWKSCAVLCHSFTSTFSRQSLMPSIVGGRVTFTAATRYRQMVWVSFFIAVVPNSHIIMFALILPVVIY